MKKYEEDDDALETSMPLLTEEKRGDDEPDTILSHILVRHGCAHGCVAYTCYHPYSFISCK